MIPSADDPFAGESRKGGTKAIDGNSELCELLWSRFTVAAVSHPKVLG